MEHSRTLLTTRAFSTRLESLADSHHVNDYHTMSPPPLTDDQHAILQALIDHHADAQHPVKRDTIAAAVECHPVTLSVRMQGLRALGLVESTSGPKGGYEPTLKAYGALAAPDGDWVVEVPIAIGGAPGRAMQVRDIGLTDIHDPHRRRATLVFDEPITRFAVGDTVRVGPTPATNIRIEGVVADTDSTTSTVVLDIDGIRAIAKDHAEGPWADHESPTDIR